VYSDSGFKYHVCRISEENVPSGQYACDCNSCFGRCECILGDCDDAFADAGDFGFFRGLRAEHYQQLYNNVFVWLNNPALMKDETDANIRNTLQKLIFDVQQTSISYEDARKHMPRKMRKNIDNYKKAIEDYNTYIDNINPSVTQRIQDIIDTNLPEQKRDWIYDLAKIGFCQSLFKEENVAAALRNWNLPDKVVSRDFVNAEANSARNILNAIQEDQTILRTLDTVQNRIRSLTEHKNTIARQSNEISNQIVHNRYRGRRWCCPNLIKELWHSLI